MPVNVNDKIRKLRPAQRKKVESRTAELIAEEMTLRELRKARKLTQVRMAKALGVTQDSVSRLEKRSDLLLSTLRKTVEAMGGTLSLVAEFPDRPAVSAVRHRGRRAAGQGGGPIKLGTPGLAARDPRRPGASCTSRRRSSGRSSAGARGWRRRHRRIAFTAAGIRRPVRRTRP
jgi:transcriptional regulator with XRE-family HTH domain